MTSKIKTVQKPRQIFIACKNMNRISEIIFDILKFCSYSTYKDVFSENADFIISKYSENFKLNENVIADTIIFDESCNIDDNSIFKFRNIVASYEYCSQKYGDDEQKLLTYSKENYDADVTCRNIVNDDGITVFNIIITGILSRVRISNKIFSVEDVLICTAVLIATGIPMASVLEYFNTSNEK